MQIINEMLDDARWAKHQEDWEKSGGIGFDFDGYFKYQMNPTTFATFFNIAAYVKKMGVSVDVLQKGFGGTLTRVWRQDSKYKEAEPMRVLLHRKHYELLCKSEKDKHDQYEPEVKRRRLTSKQTVHKRPAGTIVG